MFKLFGKKKESKPMEIATTMSGKVIPLELVPDPVFAGKMVGDGFAIEPTNGKVCAPAAGKIVQMFPTHHAFGILTDEGVEILVHVGIDTVQLRGEGFTPHKQVGDSVAMGELILEVDLAVLSEAGKSSVTPVIITNMDLVETLELESDGLLKMAGTSVLTVFLK